MYEGNYYLEWQNFTRACEASIFGVNFVMVSELLQQNVKCYHRNVMLQGKGNQN